MLLECSTSNIILRIEMLTMKTIVIFFASWRDFLFFRGYWFVLRVALYLLPSSLFTTTIGSLPHWRTDCTTWTKKEQAYRLRLEHFCDSHIYKYRSLAAKLRSTRLWRSLAQFSHSLKLTWTLCLKSKQKVKLLPVN